MNRFLGFAKIGVGLIAATVVCSRMVAAENPATTAALSVEGTAIVKNWVTPVYPSELQSANVQGQVKVNFVVESDGSTRDPVIVESDDHRFDESILASIRTSKFTPALEQGHAVAESVQVIWNYRLPYKPESFVELKPLPKTPAIILNQSSIEYPSSLIPRRLDGQVLCDLEVGVDGTVTAVHIQGASDADFLPNALATVNSWHFKPAMQGTVPITDKKIAPIVFTYDQNLSNDKRSVLEVNGITVTPAAGDATPLPSDPQILVLPEPVYPMNELLAGHEGDAEVAFSVNEQGAPGPISVVSASLPDFGKSLAAAAEFSLFKPALRDGKTTTTSLHRKYHFALPSATPELGESDEIRIRRLLRSGQSFSSAKGLDKPLRPIWRISPVYPAALKGDNAPSGKAEIEMVIDQQGRVRVPKINSSSKDEFGWSAATTVSQWAFDPPLRNGQPTEVRVRIPFVFSPPK